jgi:nucleoside-diphosphate-sugar epimerase
MGLTDETLLITGFPGFFARRLAFHLLEAEPTLRLVLLRRPSDADASAIHLASLDPARRDRVSEVDADPAALDFGLSGAEYRELARSVQRVYHFASVLDVGDKNADQARHNIACAREVLEFSSAVENLRGLVLLSSVAVSGGRTGVIREDELSEGQSFRGPLDESLATVELMFARHPELPQIVLRPTQIVGDSRTGELDQPGFPYPWLVFIDRSPEEFVVPVPQRPDATVQIVPIDFVVRAAHYLGARSAAYGKRYHLVDPEPPTLKEFLHLAAEAAGKRMSATFNAGAFTRGLVASPTLRLLSQGARGLLDLFAASPRYDARNAEAALAGSGIECPTIASYLVPLLERARIGFAAHEVEPVDLASGDG